MRESTVEKRRKGLTCGSYIVRLQPWSAARLSYREVLARTSIFGPVAVRNRYDRMQSPNAGRGWQRAHLLATSYGIAVRPINEP